MSQRDVLAVLERTPKEWISIDILLSTLNISKRALQDNVRALVKAGWVEIRYERRKLIDKGTFRWVAYYKLTPLYLKLLYEGNKG